MTPKFELLRRGSRRQIAALLFVCVAATPVHALAQSAVKVLVNDEAITSYEIQSRGKMLALFTHGKQGQKEAADQLVDERLMLQEAKRRKLTTSDADVDAEFADRAKSSKMTPGQFSAALRGAGVDPQTFKDFLRANITWSRIVKARFAATEKVTELDVAAALAGKEQAAERTQINEYMLQPVIFIVPQGAAKGVDAQMKARAESFRSGFQGCDNSLQQVGAAPGVVVKPTVRREETQLPKDMKAELAGAAVGTASTVLRVDDGYQTLGLCAKRQIAGKTTETEQVRDELSSERGKMLARRYLRDLRTDAVIEYR